MRSCPRPCWPRSRWMNDGHSNHLALGCRIDRESDTLERHQPGMQHMLTVTEAARRYLTRLVQAKSTRDKTIRLVLSGSKFQIALDKARPDDMTITHEGNTVLVFDDKVSIRLEGHRLDVEGVADSKRLALSKPQ